MRKIQSLKILILCVLVCQITGVLGAFFTLPASPGWYASLQKPVYNPPNAVFGPVWTILYVLMAAALYLVLVSSAEDKLKRKAKRLFAVQLVLNAAWSWLFFGLKNPAAAFADILLLWAAVVCLMFVFRRISSLAFGLLIPYGIWITFAALLNFKIWQLNL